MSWGITVLRNSGQSNAVIEKVTLLDARNLRLTASYVVPITGNTDYGSWQEYPPAPPQHGVEWSQHTLARGAHIPPQVGPQHANLVTVLKPTGRIAGHRRAVPRRRDRVPAGDSHQVRVDRRHQVMPDGLEHKIPGLASTTAAR